MGSLYGSTHPKEVAMFHHFVVIILLNPVAAFFGTKQLFSKVQKVLQSVRAVLKHSKK